MVLQGSARSVQLWHRIRFLLLVLAALFVAHDATYVAHHGPGEQLSAAMRDAGHGDHWTGFTLVALASAGLLALGCIGRLARLASRARERSHTSGRGASRGPSYVRELAALWVRLLPAVTLAFTVLENAEHLVSAGEPIGIAALTGPEYPLSVPVLALVTLVVSAIGALVRWRIAILELAITERPRPRHSRAIAAAPRPRDWWIVAALCAYRWIGARPDPGRAPPAALGT